MFVIPSHACYCPASQFENIWLRTKRKNADGKVVGGSGGVCYLYFPARPAGEAAAGAGFCGGALGNGAGSRS